MAVSIRKRAISELVQADCQVTDEVRDVVRLSGNAVNGIFQIEKINIDNPSAELALGVIISKATSTRCTVQIGGQVAGLYTGLSAGEPLFVGIDSKLSHSIPTKSLTGVRLLYNVALALTSDVFLMRFSLPKKMAVA